MMSLSVRTIAVAVLSAVLHAAGAYPSVTYAAGAVRVADAAPWFGTWRLEPPKTAPRWFETPLYKKVTITIEPFEDAPGDPSSEGLRVTYDLVRTRGGITHMEWVGRFDARDHPVQGIATFTTNAYRRIDDHTYEIVIKVDGATAAVATAVVSSDGASMTATTVERSGGTSTAVYRKR